MKNLFLAGIMAICANGLFAQSFVLDTFFNGDGTVTTDFGADDRINDIAIQLNGKMVAVGSSLGTNGVIARYSTSGQVDSNFATGGKLVSLSYTWRSVSLQNNGKIVIAGYLNDTTETNIALARLNPDGSLDTSFSNLGSPGFVVYDFVQNIEIIFDIAIQPDGKIVAAAVVAGTPGSSRVIRFNTDGTLDSTFAFDGQLIIPGGTEPRSLVLQPDGMIIVVMGFPGQDFMLARSNPDGTLDSTFGTNGIVTTDLGSVDESNSICLQPDGKIIVAGNVNDNYALARYETNGTLDNGFGTNGKIGTNFSLKEAGTHSVALQPDGKIVVVGELNTGGNSSFGVARFNTNGSLDNSFSPGGLISTSFGPSTDDIATSVAIQPDSGIVVAGFSNNGTDVDFALARYRENITVSNDSVWPGDANSDGVANNFDLLSIGVGYGFSGPSRPGADTSWTAQSCPDWVDTFATGVNFKHADCTGEGMIDLNDVPVIPQNYGRNHAKTSNNNRVIDPDIFLALPKDSFTVGDTVRGTIQLGTANKPVNIYGLAFSLTYNNNLVDSNSFRVDFTNSWVTAPGPGISLAKDLWFDSKIDLGISRTDHNNVSNYGTIANIEFVIQDNIDGKDYFVTALDLQFDLVVAIASDESTVNITSGGDTIYIRQEVSGISLLKTSDTRVTVYPNPTSGVVKIISEVPIQEIAMVNLVGQKINHIKVNHNDHVELDMSSLETGVYIIKVRLEDSTEIHKKVLLSK